MECFDFLVSVCFPRPVIGYPHACSSHSLVIRAGSEYSGAQSPPNTPSKLARGNSASSLVQFPPLPPIRMPELPEESRSSKSIRSYPESEALTQSVPGSPFSIARLDEQRPNTRETGGKRTFTPDTVSVR